MREALIDNMRRIGFDAYEVGGCIRDELLGKKAKDIDFAVCGVTYHDLVVALRREGVVTDNEVGGRLVGCRLLADWTPKEGIEISLARTEKSTARGRAFFEVETDPALTIEEDLSRRDFTINAIARSVHSGELIDPFGGADDIASMTLRVIGPESFDDDPSRILRGLVRVAKDGFRPDSETLSQMQLHAAKLAVEPAEQIYLELDRLLAGNYAADAIRIGAATGALQASLPELAPIVGFEQESRYHDLTCDEHTFRVLEEACQRGANQVVRWAAVFHDVGKPIMAWRGEDGNLHFYPNPNEPGGKSHEAVGAVITREALDRLKQPPEDFREDVVQLVAEHMYADDRRVTAFRARRFIQRVGRDHVDDLLLLRRCDRAGKGYGPLATDEDVILRSWEKLVDEQRHQPLVITDLAVSGYDAMSFGFRGREIGEMFRGLLEIVTADPTLNTRERLLSIISRRSIRQGKLIEDEADQKYAARLGLRKEAQ